MEHSLMYIHYMKFDFMKSYKIFKKETFTIKKKRIQVFLCNK